GTTGPVSVDRSEERRVGEEGGSGRALADYTSELTCVDTAPDDDVTLVDGEAVTSKQFLVPEGAVVVCTFTNTRKTASVTVVKDFVGTAGLVDLSVTGSGPGVPASATDQGDGGTTGPVSVD